MCIYWLQSDGIKEYFHWFFVVCDSPIYKDHCQILSAETGQRRIQSGKLDFAMWCWICCCHVVLLPAACVWVMEAGACRCGNVVSAVIEKEATGRPKGVAILEFETEEGRRVALTLSGIFFCYSFNTYIMIQRRESALCLSNGARIYFGALLDLLASLHTVWFIISATI